MEVELKRLQGLNELMEKFIIELESVNEFQNSQILWLEQSLGHIQFKNKVLEEKNRMLNHEIENLKKAWELQIFVTEQPIHAILNAVKCKIIL